MKMNCSGSPSSVRMISLRTALMLNPLKTSGTRTRAVSVSASALPPLSDVRPLFTLTLTKSSFSGTAMRVLRIQNC